MSYHDLEEVISDAVTDSQLPPEEVETPEVEEAPELQAEESVEAAPEVEDSPEQVATKSNEQPEPEATEEQPTTDDFEKLTGIPKMSPVGRENRIPYSRVKKITEKAVNELAEAALGRKLNQGEKAVDVVRQHVAQIPELTAKVTDYEDRLTKVGEFEDIMANEPKRFVQMLSKLPAYAGFFNAVQKAFEAQRAAAGAEPTTQAQQEPASPNDPMPEPTEENPDGSKTYSMEGLKALLDWNARQAEARAEARITKRFEERYGPIENEWKQRQYREAVLPIVRAKIEEAKTWPHFTENEEEITRVLAEDANISLEAAYQKVVFPKLITDRDKMRQDLIKELKAAPRTTAVTGAKTPAKSAPAGNMSIEDIIKAEVDKIR